MNDFGITSRPILVGLVSLVSLMNLVSDDIMKKCER